MMTVAEQYGHEQGANKHERHPPSDEGRRRLMHVIPPKWNMVRPTLASGAERLHGFAADASPAAGTPRP